jgi:hypothetical protein
MTTIKFIAILLIQTISFHTNGQTKCDFKIDTAKILAHLELEPLLSEFQTDSFKISVDQKDIPYPIRKQLNCLTRGFSIANPGKPYQMTDVIVQKLPRRQLVFLAVNKNMLVITYLMGQMGLPRKILIVKFNKNNISNLWSGQGFNDLNSKEGIIQFIRTTLADGKELNSNMIYF